MLPNSSQNLPDDVEKGSDLVHAHLALMTQKRPNTCPCLISMSLAPAL
ncbi:hypothetical protein M2310_006750 [Rhizobium leguminosarum]|uniref:Uncharacterized protein n=1 Tax=Rhizobium esperanzae TaxID=1967781 RepID=A0A7W6US99_9HYPH|nr:hypothetical protein [Rhizobium esperanzae]MDH6206058.1 hypothetical protein [Rhizobium leguminosarum]